MDKWICVLLVITVVQEAIAGFLSARHINNFLSFHIYTPIELFIVINYFVRATIIPNARAVGLYSGLFVVGLSIANTIFLQPYYKMNSYYLLFEGILIISLCLFSYYRLLIRDDVIPTRMTVFWITTFYLFYWCLSYINLGMWTAVKYSDAFAKVLGYSLYYANLLFYLSVMLVFLFYKKLVPSGE